ncbi:hypothetical protein ABKN59_008157 [Abortiporus biennis]
MQVVRREGELLLLLISPKHARGNVVPQLFLLPYDYPLSLADLKNVDAEVLDAAINALQELKKETKSKEEVKPSPGSLRVRLFDALPDDWTRQIRASAPAIDENKNHRF